MIHRALYRLVIIMILAVLLSSCSSTPKIRRSKVSYMEIFIPSKFVPEELLKDIKNIEFKVYIDFKPYEGGLKLKRSGFGGYYTLVNPYKEKTFTRSMSDTCIPFAEGWHEISVTRKYKGEELPIPLRLTGKKSSKYNDEPKDNKISKMFVFNEGPGSDGQYYVQFGLTPCENFPEPSSLKSVKLALPVKKNGYISFTSIPQAEVYLNKDFIGMTPIEKLKVLEGKSTIEIKKEGYKSWIKEIRIMPDSHVPVEVTLDKVGYVDEDWKPKETQDTGHKTQD
ncbi:MAG: PEGA domain-containing protein [Candidatus Aureabacteria bacterium]|nr:PEGA domain-containing protein [Candidatus Auribacterota bacterium]